MTKKKPKTTKKPKGLAALLADVDATGLADSAVERAAGLPGSFLSKARRGGCGSARAASSWAKLRQWLEARSDGSAPPVAATAVADAEPEIPAELIEAIDKADDFSALGALLKRLSRDLAAGEIDRHVALALCDIVRERRQCLVREAQENARRDFSERALVLTSEEVDVVVALRRSKEPRPLAPTEKVAPPSGGAP